MKEPGLVLLCIRPRESPSHPLHWILPYRLLPMHLREQVVIHCKATRKEVKKCCYHYCYTSDDVCVCVFTLIPSLAPSCRYGIIEWFHRSMNHCLNSATDTGHERKKQGPEGGTFYVNRCPVPGPIMPRFLFYALADRVSAVAHL